MQLVATAAMTALVTYLITWHSASNHRQWFIEDNGVVYLDPEIRQLIPAEYESYWEDAWLPPQYGQARIVIGSHPIAVAIQDKKGGHTILSLQFEPRSGITFKDVQTDEILARFAPDLGLILGSGTPDAQYLSWARDMRLHKQLTPVLITGMNSTSKLNNLVISSRTQLDANTYVGRGHHKENPSYTGTAIVRGSHSIFLADVGPTLINDVPLGSLEANTDADAIVGGTVVTLDVIAVDTGGTSMHDDPGNISIVVRTFAKGATCTSYGNLQDTLYNYMMTPGQNLDDRANAAIAEFWATARAIDQDGYDIIEGFRTSPTAGVDMGLYLDPDEPCKMSTGTIFILAKHEGGEKANQRFTIETHPIVCSDDQRQLICQGRNAYLASVAM